MPTSKSDLIWSFMIITHSWVRILMSDSVLESLESELSNGVTFNCTKKTEVVRDYSNFYNFTLSKNFVQECTF